MTLEEKLLSKRVIEDKGYITPCWIFIGATGSKGYGRIWDGNVVTSAHILAARLWLKDFTSTLCVLHKCDIRTCFNPDHLFMGSKLDNNRDMVAKKRHNNTKKTHCKRGHEFSEANTMYNSFSGSRICRICHNARSAKNNLLR
jgi:hypothetical protein